MTWDDRLRAVATLGFTERQAGFLITVMLHAGVCLGRHYCAYGGIAHGQKERDFFRVLLARRYATARACGHHRARLFHLHYKPLYRAIGEPDNRHRRPTTLARAVERLMVLDAVLAERHHTWLATEHEKQAYFTLTHRVARQDLPHLTFRSDDDENRYSTPRSRPFWRRGSRGAQRSWNATSCRIGTSTFFPWLARHDRAHLARTGDEEGDEDPGDVRPPGGGGDRAVKTAEGWRVDP